MFEISIGDPVVSRFAPADAFAIECKAGESYGDYEDIFVIGPFPNTDEVMPYLEDALCTCERMSDVKNDMDYDEDSVPGFTKWFGDRDTAEFKNLPDTETVKELTPFIDMGWPLEWPHPYGDGMQKRFTGYKVSYYDSTRIEHQVSITF